MLPFCLHRATKLTQNCACFTNPQTRNQLVTPGEEKSFLRGVQIFELCSTHFPRGQKTFQGGSPPCSPLGYGPANTCINLLFPPSVTREYHPRCLAPTAMCCRFVFFLYGGLLLALYNYNGLVAPRLSCTISGFILLGLFS